MDPLSIAASVITVTGAAINIANTTLQLIDLFRNAPMEILALRNDITDLKAVVTHMRDEAAHNKNLAALAREAELAIPGFESLSDSATLVNRVQIKLSEIELLLRKTISAKTLTGVVVKHLSWNRHKAQLRFLHDELRDMKSNLSLSLTTRTRSSFPILGQLRVLYLTLSSTFGLRNNLLLRHALIEHAESVVVQNTRDEKLNDLMQEIAQQLNQLKDLPGHQRQSGDKLHALCTQLMSEMARLGSITVTEERQQVMTTTRAAETLSNRSTSQPIDITRTTTTDATVSRFKLEFSRFQKRSCSGLCSCTCHQRSRYRTPSVAQRVLGMLFIGYNSLPFWGAKCSEPSCIERSPFSATLTYYFPFWSVAKMISVVLTTTISGDPAACIKIRPISFDFSIFRMSAIGDLGGVKALLERRAAHPGAGYMGYVATESIMSWR